MDDVIRNEDPLWTTDDVAQYLRRPVGTIRQWRSRKYGPRGFRLGGMVMYRRSEVMRWLDEQERADQ